MENFVRYRFFVLGFLDLEWWQPKQSMLKDEEQLKYSYLTSQRTDFLEQAMLTNAKSWNITEHAAEQNRLISHQQKWLICNPIAL